MAHYLEEDIISEVGLTSKEFSHLNMNRLDVHIVKRIGHLVHITTVSSDTEIQHNMLVAKKADEAKFLAGEGWEGWEGKLFKNTVTETKVYSGAVYN